MAQPPRLTADTAARVAAAGLLICLVAGLLVPIYTDEVTWRMQLSRSIVDGGFDRGLADQCGPGTMLRAPWFLQPMRHASSWVSLALPQPAWVRIGGVAGALLWVALAWRLGARVAGEARQPARAVLLSLAGLGVLPFLLVWSRPEQPLLLCYTLAILIALAPPATSGRGAWARASALVLLGIVTLGYHPKAVVFLPILCAAVALSSRGAAGRAARIAAIALLCAFGIVAFRYWTARFACPGDPLLAAKLAAENVGAGGLASVAAIARMMGNANPWGYVAQALPSPDYMSNWLPGVAIPAAIGIAWQLGLALVWWAAILLAAALLIAQGLRAARTRRLPSAPVLGAVIAAVILAWGATQLRKNSYEAALSLPLLALALVLLVPWEAPRARRIAGRGVVALVACAIASEALLLACYVPALARIAGTPGAIAAQPVSFVPWHYPALAAEIAAAARACAIDPVRAHDVLVDDVTYFAMIRSARPQHLMAVIGPWAGSVRDPLAYLAARGSSGVITACASFPSALRARARRIGGTCCIPGAALAAR